jgi:chromosome segregation ATPase
MGEIDKLQSESKDAKNERQNLFEERLTLEKEKARHEFNVLSNEKTLLDLRNWVEQGQKSIRHILDSVLSLENGKSTSNSNNPEAQISSLKTAATELSKWPETLEQKIKALEEGVKSSSGLISELDAQLNNVKDKTRQTESTLDSLGNQLLEKRIALAIFEYQKKELSIEIEEIGRTLRALEADLGAAIRRAEEQGARIVALRTTDEVLDEIRMVDGRIAAMADVSEQIERMYESYSNLYLELKEKTRIAAENREKVLAEIKTRMDAWRNMIRTLLDNVSLEYRRILSHATATGAIRLSDDQDIEATGIDLLVGFKGSQPIPLNIYSQSGGERSTAVMSFLLALQQHVKSPFRAIDEYDVHMDPKNREVIANLLISAVEGGMAQYLAITPNQMYFEGKDIHIITVQNIEGTSLVKEVN